MIISKAESKGTSDIRYVMGLTKESDAEIERLHPTNGFIYVWSDTGHKMPEDVHRDSKRGRLSTCSLNTY